MNKQVNAKKESLKKYFHDAEHAFSYYRYIGIEGIIADLAEYNLDISLAASFLRNFDLQSVAMATVMLPW